MGFVKIYPTAEAASRAMAHHAWLARLGTPVPRLLSCQGTALEHETVTGHHVGPQELPAVAAVLATAHAAAYSATLHQARLDQPFWLHGVGELEAFTTPRSARVRALLGMDVVPQPTLTASQAQRILASSTSEPAAFYKDANPRNFLVTADGIVVIDFDDLTLAPFGYDLAKLVVTTTMTHGLLPEAIIRCSLATYNERVPHPCTRERLHDWMEIHHILTAPYLDRHGYAYAWRNPNPTEKRSR